MKGHVYYVTEIYWISRVASIPYFASFWFVDNRIWTWAVEKPEADFTTVVQLIIILISDA